MTSHNTKSGWVGVWRNQYGSIVEITGETNGRIEGFFQSALEGSDFHDGKTAIAGVCQDDMISFAVAGGGPGGSAVAYTGLLRHDRMETLRHLVKSEILAAGKEGAPAQKESLEWWRAVTTGADTFERYHGSTDDAETPAK